MIGIDLLEIDPIEGVEFRVMDFHDPDAPRRLREWLGGPADGVMSDMAANATGHRKTDHLRIVGLAELAIDFARDVLAPGGFFVAKVLQGGSEGELLANLKHDFSAVRHVKPKASRADSAELYVLATGFRGRARSVPVAGLAEAGLFSIAGRASHRRRDPRPWLQGGRRRDREHDLVGFDIADLQLRGPGGEHEAHALAHAGASLLAGESLDFTRAPF